MTETTTTTWYALDDPDAAMGRAWRRCEEALPETGRVHLQRRAEAAEVDNHGERWVARQGRAPGRYEAWATDVASMKSLGFAYRETPADALNALADLLEPTR